MSRYFQAFEKAASIGADSDSMPRIEVAENRSHVAELVAAADEETIKLVERLFVLPNSHAPRAVVFSSVDGRDSAWICLRAGAALAMQGASVCVVDGNLNTPSIHQFCRIQQHPGLLDAAVKPGPVTDFVVSVGNKLWILPSGEAPVGAQRITVSDRMRFRVTELRKLFDYVLIDAPPIGSCSDALLFGQVVDGFVLIVEANLTRRENARIAKETIDSAHVKLLGVILNNRTFPIPESLYRKL